MMGSEVAILARGSRSYRQMARECGVSKSELHNLETRNISPRIVTAQRICSVAENGITFQDFAEADYEAE